MASERSELEQRRAELTHRSPSTRQPVNVLPLTRRVVDSFDQPGLFMVPLDEPRAMSVAAKNHDLAMRPRRGQVASPDRHKSGLRRYCTGCAQETEHVARAADEQGGIPEIRWPTTEPAIGTTICLTCGQWRAATSRPTLPLWSSWPREAGPPRRVSPSLLTPPTPQRIGFPKPQPRTRDAPYGALSLGEQSSDSHGQHLGIQVRRGTHSVRAHQAVEGGGC